MSRNLFVILFLGLMATFFEPLGLRCTALADFPVQPYPAIRYEHLITRNPAEDIQIVRVNLKDPNVDVRVSRGGEDPDGPGEYETTLQTPSAIAEREHFEVAVNGDFFEAQKTTDAEGTQSGYVTGKWAKVLGPAVTDGTLWGPAQTARPALIIDANKHAHLATIQIVPPNALQIIAGSHIIVSSGKVSVEPKAGFVNTLHPRTAVGISDGGKTLFLVVVDGRREKSAGMSLPDLAALMLKLGCRDALNLDGGGSSELVLRDPVSAQLEVMNTPSDGRERAVTNVLGISIRGVKRSPLPAKAPN
jgi:hypothetical protein